MSSYSRGQGLFPRSRLPGRSLHIKCWYKLVPALLCWNVELRNNRQVDCDLESIEVGGGEVIWLRRFCVATRNSEEVRVSIV
jgi:hypothetical protein